MISDLKWIVLILLVFYNIDVVKAQNNYVDSLKTAVEGMKSDTAKVNTLLEISANIYYTDPDEAIQYAERARNMAEDLGFSVGLGYALKNIGLGHETKGEYRNVLENWESSLAIFRSVGFKPGEANLLSNLGNVYFNQGDNTRALEYYLQALRIAEEINDHARIAILMSNIGGIYNDQENTKPKAIDYFRRAVSISADINDKYIKALIRLNLGEALLTQQDYDEALSYFNEALVIFRNEQSKPDEAAVLILIGKVFAARSSYDEAINYQQQALVIATEVESDLDIIQALIGLGNTLKMKGDIESAVPYYQRAAKRAEEVGLDYDLRDAYFGLSDTFGRLRDYENAYGYQKRYMQLNDSIFNMETDDEIRGLQFSYDLDKKQAEVDLQKIRAERQRAISYGAGIAGVLLLFLAGLLYNRYKYTQRTGKIIQDERDRSNDLLLNILPEETAEELKHDGKAKARKYDNVSILFTDFKGFTKIAAVMDADDLVRELNECYRVFDDITTKYGIEKIKTIGDAYMAAGGLPTVNETHFMDVINAALEMRDFIDKLKEEKIKADQPYFEIRLGIHTGPVVAGIVGSKKFQYDIWGDTVNIASRMESNSEPGKINISESTYELVKDEFECTYRGIFEARNRGKLKMYFAERNPVIKEPSDTSADATIV